MSNLYYANLGDDNPEQFQERVVQRLRDFQTFLYYAQKNMEKRTYEFSFNVKETRGKVVPQDKTLKKNVFKVDGLFFDEELKQNIPNERINKKRKEIVLDGRKYQQTVYAKSNNQCIPCTFEPQSYTLNNIHPKSVSITGDGNGNRSHRIKEDEEDIALDFLSESDTISIKNKGIAKYIHFKNRLHQKEAIIVDKLPDNGTFRVAYNTYILKRQREAVEDLAVSPQKHHVPLLNLLRQKDRDFTWGSVDMSFTPDRWFVLTDESRDGTEEQREFVKRAWGTPDFAILEGPPGSGKTTTLLELIAQAISRNQRVLMVASTHVAVDNVLEKMLETYVKTDDGETSLKEACGAIPLRIGDEGNVSEAIQQFCLNQFAETETEHLKKFLGKVASENNLTEAQKSWQTSLSKKDAKQYIETLLLDVANLVCGTTIGILQAPIIKNAHISEPLFDLVILDEASKTTFQEFLVPALYGKKWILSGDVKQLSPYVDQTPIEMNLQSLPSFTKADGQKDREICYTAFQASSQSRGKKSVLILKDTEEEISEFTYYLRQQAEGMDRFCEKHDLGKTGITCTGVDQLPYTNSQKLAILAANVIVTKKELVPKIEPYLPTNIVTDCKPSLNPFSDEFKRRMKSSRNNTGILEDKSWEGEITWRLGRMHELRNLQDQYDSLSRDVKLLIPHFEREQGDRKRKRFDLVEREIGKIRRIALPSVLELLQEGYETSYNGRGSDLIALYSGLSYAGNEPQILSMRHTLLTHQHRMDPRISYLPRKYVYEGKALKNANGDEGMKREREWNYTRYSSRCVWVDIQPRHGDLVSGKSKYNKAEIRAIRNALEDFMAWAKDNPNEKDKNGNWSVAILPFYKGQANRIKEELQDISKRNGIYSEFVRNDCNVSVKICTVDRFQGHEADVVFLSFVQSCQYRGKNHCKKSKIGFLNYQNRLNVAVTRARYQLVMFGDKQNFEAANEKFLKALATESTPGDIEFGGVN